MLLSLFEIEADGDSKFEFRSEPWQQIFVSKLFVKSKNLESTAVDIRSVAHVKVCNTAASWSACVSRRKTTDARKHPRDPNIPNEEHRKARNASWDWLTATPPIEDEG